MPVTPSTRKQWTILERWVAVLQQLPEVDLVWLEGSLASGRGNAGSDIDLRLALADHAYTQLWETDRTPLLAGLGDYCLVETRYVRAITADAVTVEAAAVKRSEVNGCELYEWEILFSRLPAGEPHFRKLPPRPTAEVWAAWEELTPAVVQGLFNIFLTTLVQVPAIFYSGEWHSAIFQLDRMRTELIKLMYRRLNIGYSSRYKHFSEFMPPAWCEQFLQTYVQGDPAKLEPPALARAYMRLLELWGEHLQVLGEEAGGGFDAAWFFLIQRQVIAQLEQFTQ
ncbi:MAG: nucleotidyltransferase domain-containing protein [Caldilineaceae bacterium]